MLPVDASVDAADAPGGPAQGAREQPDHNHYNHNHDDYNVDHDHNFDHDYHSAAGG